MRNAAARRRKHNAMSRLLGVVMATGLCAGSGVAAAATSPSQIVAAALANARTQSSVHYVSAFVSGGVSVTITGDAARDRGSQRITYRKAGRVGHVTVLVVANTAFVRGDAFTLANYMRIPSSSASAWAGKWLSIDHTAPDFAAVAAAVRLASTLDELTMPPPLRTSVTSSRLGRPVTGVTSNFQRAGHPVTETLYLDRARKLPLELIGTSGTTTSRTTLSRWNEPVAISAPRSAIAIR